MLERENGRKRSDKGIGAEAGKDTEIVAIKVIDLETAEESIEDIRQEIQHLSQFDFPNITRYFGSILQKTSIAVDSDGVSGGRVLFGFGRI